MLKLGRTIFRLKVKLFLKQYSSISIMLQSLKSSLKFNKVFLQQEQIHFGDLNVNVEKFLTDLAKCVDRGRQTSERFLYLVLNCIYG